MEDIKKHNFIDAKKRIRDFKLSNIDNSFARIEEKEFFGLFDRNVTGREMNQYIDKVQSAFIGVNKYINDIVTEFKEIYNALDALDNEYIEGIIQSLKESQRAINQNATTVSNLNASVLRLLELEQSVIELEKRTQLIVEAVRDKQNETKFNAFFNSLYYKIFIAVFAISSFVISLLLLLSK